jgi:outer membrane protein with beta-barrel domain
MRLAAIAALLLVCAPATARADGFYFQEGVGTGEVHGPMGDFFAADGVVGSLSVGRRIDRLAIEANLSLADLSGRGPFAGAAYTAVGWGLRARYLFPVNPHLDLYLRGGLDRTELVPVGFGDPADGSAYGGRGLSYGAGAQVKGKVRALGFLFWPLFFTGLGPKINAGFWLDTGAHRVRLHHPHWRSLDGTVTSWALGFAVGSDF